RSPPTSRGRAPSSPRRSRPPADSRVPGPKRVVLVVPPAAAGIRLDRFLAGAAAVGTRSQAKQLIDRGQVRVDGRGRKGSFALRAGARVEAEVPPPEPFGVEPEALPL